MPNVAKVLVSNQTYDIKDSVARNNNSLVQTEIEQVEERLQGEINALGERVTKNTQDIEQFEHSGVITVNGKDGNVVLKAADVQATPIDHIDVEADNSTLGHVTVTDNYKTETAPAGASIAASAKALQEAYAEIKDNMLEKRHDSATTDYGIGTPVLYGHVKVDHNFDIPDPERNAGVAASAYALQSAYNDLSQQIESSIPDPGVFSVNGHTGYKTPSHPEESGGNIVLTAEDIQAASIEHSSPVASGVTPYGLGTDEYYGHVTLSDQYDNDVPDTQIDGAGTGIAASSYAVQKAYRDLLTIIDELQQSISGYAKEIGFDNTRSNLTIIDPSTGEEKPVENVQDAIDEVVAKTGPITVNPDLNKGEGYLDLETIQIGPFKYRFKVPQEISIGKIAPADPGVQLFVDTSKSYGNAFNLQHIEECEEGF